MKLLSTLFRVLYTWASDEVIYSSILPMHVCIHEILPIPYFHLREIKHIAFQNSHGLNRNMDILLLKLQMYNLSNLTYYKPTTKYNHFLHAIHPFWALFLGHSSNKSLKQIQSIDLLKHAIGDFLFYFKYAHFHTTCLSLALLTLYYTYIYT